MQFRLNLCEICITLCVIFTLQIAKTDHANGNTGCSTVLKVVCYITVPVHISQN